MHWVKFRIIRPSQKMMKFDFTTTNYTGRIKFHHFLTGSDNPEFYPMYYPLIQTAIKAIIAITAILARVIVHSHSSNSQISPFSDWV